MSIRRFSTIFAVCIAALTAGHAPAADPVPADRPPRDALLIHRVELPLENGRLDMNVLLARILEQAGLDAAPLADLPPWTIDVTNRLGTLQLYALRNATGGAVEMEVDDHRMTIIFDRIVMRRQEKQMRTRLRTLMQHWFAKDAAEAAQGYGTRQWHARDQSVPLAQAKLRSEAVLLIHGLDEGSGRVWEELIPQLLATDFVTLEFRYPNDQPIADSAAMLERSLRELREAGVERLSIVAHSMGGLVAREVLTHPAMYADAETRQAYPRVTRLIMAGTPNHGSTLARLHLAAEARDQIIRALSGDGMIFGAIFDGAGEAEVDLLPHSDFLTTLNARPTPEDVKITTIAGNTSPVTRERIEMLRDVADDLLPPDRQAQSAELFEALLKVVDGLGDGAVPIESARLDGVEDHVDVDANHVTMLRKMPGVPSDHPAIAVILDRLQTDREDLAAGRTA